jgi:hypothetical protein
MGATHPRWTLAALAASTVLAGCSVGSHEGADPAAEPGENPLATKANAFTVAVVERRATATLPVRGARVVLDKPGGARVTATTGADGRAHFDDVDFGRGEASLTIVERDHVMRSLVGLTGADVSSGDLKPRAVGDVASPRAVTCFVARTRMPERATLSGALVNKQASSHFVTLGASVGSGSFQGTRASYSLDVERDRPFSVIGFEWTPSTGTVGRRSIAQVFYQWARWDRLALSADATAPLDFRAATPLTPVRTGGRIVIPRGAAGPLGAATKGYATVNAAGGAVLGATARSDLLMSGAAFDYQMEHVVVDGVAQVTTDFVIAREDGAASYVERPGYPEADDTVEGFLLPPEAPEGILPLFEAVPFRDLPATTTPRLLVRDGFGAVKWTIDGPAGRASLRAPALDTEGEAELGGADRARLVALEGYDAATGDFARVAMSRETSIAR